MRLHGVECSAVRNIVVILMMGRFMVSVMSSFMMILMMFVWCIIARMWMMGHRSMRNVSSKWLVVAIHLVLMHVRHVVVLFVIVMFRFKCKLPSKRIVQVFWMPMLVLVSWRVVEMTSGMASMREMTIVVVDRQIFSPRVVVSGIWMLNWCRYRVPSAAYKREKPVPEIGILGLFS